MLDHQEARIWADHHQSFSALIGDLVHQAGDAFAALARIQYDRPWAQPTNVEAGCTAKR